MKRPSLTPLSGQAASAVQPAGVQPQGALRSALAQVRQLTRAELSSMVALSALTGYLFSGQGWLARGILLTAAIWLLAAASSALNQVQERDLDARMDRTRRRPLPAGQLQPLTVLGFSLGLFGAGTLLLAACGIKPLLLGLLTAIWYNGIYTPLKRRTPFAALPGALCGALPPLIGWSAAGGDLLDARIILLAGTLFLWQVPHTWLLLCHYRDDLGRSGLPNLFERISTPQLLRINSCWLAALWLCYLLFPLFGLLSSQPLLVLYLLALCALALLLLIELQKEAFRIAPKRLFHLTNLSLALLLSCLILENLPF